LVFGSSNAGIGDCSFIPGKIGKNKYTLFNEEENIRNFSVKLCVGSVYLCEIAITQSFSKNHKVSQRKRAIITEH